MKRIIILRFLILTNLTYGQHQLDSLLSNPDYYVFNKTKDTLYLTKIDVHKTETFWNRPLKSTKVYNTIQIDGTGSKEIIFERTYRGTSERYLQAFSSKDTTTIRKFEIWNIDTKTLLFEAISEYEFNYESKQLGYRLYPDSFYNNNGYIIGRCSYNYTFSIDSIGLINIDRIRYNNKNNDCIADKKEGFYKFTDGKYTIE